MITLKAISEQYDMKPRAIARAIEDAGGHAYNPTYIWQVIKGHRPMTTELVDAVVLAFGEKNLSATETIVD